MIFTAGPLSRNQVSSERFKRMGAVNVAPCQISEVRIGPVPMAKGPESVVFFIANFYAFLAAIALQRAVDPETFANIFTIGLPTNFVRLFPLPMMAVAINKPSPSAIEKLGALNFQKQSQGRYIFYTGPSTDEAMRDVVQITGVQADAYCPRGFSSVHGIITLNIINRALYYGFLAMSHIMTISKDSIPTPDQGFAINESNYADISGGIFFPYFEGLLLADHGMTISTLVSRISRCLGKNAAEITENCEILYSGWGSVANTNAGRAASHAIWCLEQAMSACVAVRPVILNGEYSGCVFLGKVAFVAYGKTVLPSKKEELIVEIGALLSHDAALKALTKIIQDNLEVEVTESSFTTYRSILNILRPFTLTNDLQQKIREQVRKLRFQETMWSISDHKKVAALVKALAKNEPFPSNVPLFSPAEHIFTKEVTLSNLAAFGAKAPCLVSKGTGVARPFGAEVYKGITSPGNLSGVPIFVHPLQEAYELWKTFFTDHVIKFSHAGKDKMGRMRVKAVDSYIDLQSPEVGDIMGALGERFRGEKRKLAEGSTDNSSSGPLPDDERRKKRRLKGLGVLFGAAAPGGSALEEDEPMAEDDPLRMFD